MHGHDVFSPSVCNAVLACLTGGDESAHAEGGTLARSAPAADPHRSGCPDEAVAVGQRGEGAEGAEGEEGEGEAGELYALLGLPRSASAGAIRAAYRQRALRLHPDRFPDATAEERAAATRRFQALAGAYEVLADPAARAEYDAARAGGAAWLRPPPSWDAAVSTFAQAMDVAGVALGSWRQAAGGDLAAHVVSRALIATAAEAGAEAVASAVVRTELQASLLAGERLTAAVALNGVGARLIPVIGAVVSGTIDAVSTARTGAAARRTFGPPTAEPAASTPPWAEGVSASAAGAAEAAVDRLTSAGAAAADAADAAEAALTDAAASLWSSVSSRLSMVG